MPNGTIRELAYLWEVTPFVDNHVIQLIRDLLRAPSGGLYDHKRWMLTRNGTFLVKSFYNFLNDGGLRCSTAKFFWRNICPKKINLFNWLVWKDKILYLENLEKRHCNRLPMATCVLCHSGKESVDHLFIYCTVARQVWDYFVQLLHLPDPPAFELYLRILEVLLDTISEGYEGSND